MRKLLCFFTLLIGMTLSPATVQGQENWEIREFAVDLKLKRDRSMEVHEMIRVDFGEQDKHGIIRHVPYKYLSRLNNRLVTEIEPISVSDENGRSIPYTVTRSGNDVVWKIGRADAYVQGEQTYYVRYRAKDIVNFFEEHEELFWNVTGNESLVNIEEARVRLMGPANLIRVKCYTGVLGSTEEACQINYEGSLAQVETERTLRVNEGLTLVAGFPAGTFERPTLVDKAWILLKHNYGYLLPVIMLVFLFGWYWREGRDRFYVNNFSETDISRVPLFAPKILKDVYYPPRGVRAAEAGLLIDEVVHNQDIAAILVDLANMGAIGIEEMEKKNYKFIKTGKKLKLKNYEETMIQSLFNGKTEVTLSSLKYKFAAKAQTIRTELYKEMTKEGYFPTRPDRVRLLYGVVGVVLIVIGLKLVVLLGQTMLGISPGLGLTISGVLVLIFHKAMPRRTAKGRAALEEILGFKRVIKLGSYRQELFEKQNYFNEILPYAIAFGLTKQWAKTVADLNLTKPDWYAGTAPFNSRHFSSSMMQLSRTASANLTAVKSSASSGSSGFSGGGSGGGFGGGGVGSW